MKATTLGHWMGALLCASLFYGCSSNHYLKQREQEFGTKGVNKWVFHRLSDRDKGTSLVFPGYIIGIEKSRRKKIGAPSKKDIHKKNGLSDFELNASYEWKKIPFRKKRMLDDVKSMFVSSIHEFVSQKTPVNRIQTKTIYDAYDSKQLANAKEAYHRGFQELEQFKARLIQEVKDKKVTHVFLFSMGWNSDQQEAIRNFNSLFSKIADQAASSGKTFRPLFIGLTWPSMWNTGVSNIASFFNKTNDADELGMTWANYLLNKVILSKEHQHDFKTVLLGHSFGAKLTSRTVMSASMLAETSKPVDLLINLQSAYSINRYSPTKGVEPTNDYENWEKYAKSIALICSKHDKAVKAGFYAPFAGGSKSYKKVTNDPKGHYSMVTPIKYRKDLFPAFSAKNKLTLIEASDIVKRSAYKKAGGAHSDIYNEEVAALLWQLIVSATY